MYINNMYFVFADILEMSILASIPIIVTPDKGSAG